VIVVDASVLVSALVDDGPAGRTAWAALSTDSDWYSVPHLHAEVVSGIRGRWLGGKVPAGRAGDSVLDLADLTLSVVDTTLLLPRMWELRHNLGAYDAAYVAAAEGLGCPLLTKDVRLAAAPGIRCEVRLAA
jgi:predicted nucleic acid-binding protein